MSITTKLLMFGLMLSLALGGIWKYKHAIEKADELELQNTQLEDKIDQLEANKLRDDAVLKEKSENEKRMRQDIAKFNQSLASLKRTDPQAATWLDTPVPASVLDRLRKPASETDASMRYSNGPDRAHPGPGN